MNNYDILINQATKVLRVLYILAVLLIIKTTVKILFMVAIPQVTYSVKMNHDARGEITSKEETTQRTIPVLHLFFNK